jgi:alanine racemase
MNGRSRPTYAVVSRARLRANLAAVKARAAPARVMAILKANAYGHGLEAVARCLAPQADSFGVALVEEGIALRRLGIGNPILVMGGIWTLQIPLFLEHRLSVTVPSIARLRDIEEAAAAAGARARLHLKIDTGMERIGVHHYSAEGLLEAAARSPHCDVEGIYTHFANADAEDLSHARLQLERFLEVLRFYERRSLPLPVRHVANSAALLRMPDALLDMARIGILLYGVYPFPGAPRAVEVQPALSWRSRVVYFKVVEAGSPVSYGSTWRSDHRVRLVTVPVGYGDGYFRSLSNRAEVVLRGERRAVVGRVCMDQLMVNIEWGEAWNGDEVVLIGEQGGARVTVEELAEWAGTIPYEILTAINARVPRIYEP